MVIFSAKKIFIALGIGRVSGAKTNACVWSEANAVALKSPTVAAVELVETRAIGTPKSKRKIQIRRKI